MVTVYFKNGTQEQYSRKYFQDILLVFFKTSIFSWKFI